MLRWLRTLIVAALALFGIYGLMNYGRGPDPSAPRTRVDVQWLIGTSTTAPADATGIGLDEVFKLEALLKSTAGGLYEVDSDDYGGGTANIVLDTAEPDKTVRHIIDLFEAGKLHPGMRIGVAKYDAAQGEWRWDPVYPPGLTNFAGTYRP